MVDHPYKCYWNSFWLTRSIQVLQPLKWWARHRSFEALQSISLANKNWQFGISPIHPEDMLVLISSVEPTRNAIYGSKQWLFMAEIIKILTCKMMIVIPSKNWPRDKQIIHCDLKYANLFGKSLIRVDATLRERRIQSIIRCRFPEKNRTGSMQNRRGATLIQRILTVH